MSVIFNVFPYMFGIVFVIVVGVFIAFAVRGISTWNKNNHSPVLTVPAVVVAKRQNISHHHHAGEMHSHSSTSYYATFQFESGDRLELLVPAYEYGYLVEGDSGRLTFQGTRFRSFERA